MVLITTSAQNLEQVPTHFVSIRDISISAELSSVPRLTGERQRKGMSGHNLAINNALLHVSF